MGVDEDGFRKPGRQRGQRRPVTSGASQVVVEDVGELHPSVQYYIGNTPGKADESIIRKVLERCAAPLLDPAEGPLVIEKLQLLTREKDPRTRCWRVEVPFKFKAIMENSELYPEGWRYREFVGNFRTSPPGTNAKRFRANGDNVVNQVMQEEGQKKQDEVDKLRQELEQLRQQQASGGAGPGLAESMQP